MFSLIRKNIWVLKIFIAPDLATFQENIVMKGAHFFESFETRQFQKYAPSVLFWIFKTPSALSNDLIDFPFLTDLGQLIC